MFDILRGLLLLAGAQDLTVLTHDGRKLAGPVRAEGAVTVVGAERVPTKDVAAVFRLPAEAAEQAQARFRTAKEAFAAAEALDVADPRRNDQLHLAIEQAQAAAGIYRALGTHYGEDAAIGAARNLQIIQQFLRLARGSSTSDLAGTAVAKGPLLPLVEFEVKAPEAVEAADRPWALATPLGPGLAERAKDLEHVDAERRLEAAKALLHPPSPEHLPALLKLLEAERDAEVIAALGAGLGRVEPGPLLKSLGWARKAGGPKAEIAMGLARAAGDRPAFDFVAAWFVESPPDRNEERALFGAAFRQFQAWSTPWLRELLTKQRAPKMQVEILRQMGVVGDKAFAPLLVKAIVAYPREATVGLQKIGKPAVPYLMEGTKSPDPDQRQPCLTLLRRITGVNGINMGHFEKWWDENRKAVAEAEAARAADPVTPADFAAYGADK